MRCLFVLLLIFRILRQGFGSQFGVSLGDAAVSQLVRHAAAKVLEEPRVVDILLKTKEAPTFGPIAHLNLFNTLKYRNLSVHFHPQIVHVFFERLDIDSHANLSDVLWPIPFSDHFIDTKIKVDKGHLKFAVDEKNLALSKCTMLAPDVYFQTRDSWLLNKGMSALSSLMTVAFESFACTLIESSIVDMKHDNEKKFPIYDILPQKIREQMAAQNTAIYYKVNSIEANEHQLRIRAQIEWQKLVENDEAATMLSAGEENNRTLLDMEMTEDDRITVWLEDAILNELLDQVDWNFEWMNEQIPVSSPIIPPDSREFLSTLCTQCYFQVNVNAKGRPSIAATNESLVLTKTDRIHLQVVNPDRNVTSVFVSLVLTIQAELRPTFDGGTLRTLVQLLDTGIEMEKGAFPKSWAFFMGDLIRGMIMDMMWPEIKNTIEELSYGKGLRLSTSCGIDPNNIQLDIGEGSFSLSTRLVLPLFDAEKCIKDLKSSLPSTSKLFQKSSR